MGALAYYVSHAEPRGYQPTNITFGIMPAPEALHGRRLKRDERKTATSARALAALDEWIEECSVRLPAVAPDGEARFGGSRRRSPAAGDDG
jgi:methylenetetrahydrofolate--tRNA-(uracil-5-)-methyltransferase